MSKIILKVGRRYRLEAEKTKIEFIPTAIDRKKNDVKLEVQKPFMAKWELCLSALENNPNVITEVGV